MGQTTLTALRRVVQVAMVGVVATPILYQVVWQVVFRLWPPACQAPYGSVLLCVVDEGYTRPRDLTAVALSLALGLIGGYVLYFATNRFVRGHSQRTVR